MGWTGLKINRELGIFQSNETLARVLKSRTSS